MSAEKWFNILEEKQKIWIPTTGTGGLSLDSFQWKYTYNFIMDTIFKNKKKKNLCDTCSKYADKNCPLYTMNPHDMVVCSAFIETDNIESRLEQLEGFTYNQSDDKWIIIKRLEKILGKFMEIFTKPLNDAYVWGSAYKRTKKLLRELRR